ncbi:carboxypeptidase S [Infundibulicybe gibba]|nr:carboxypeptidase S [Infundibulicybe gibba]
MSSVEKGDYLVSASLDPFTLPRQKGSKTKQLFITLIGATCLCVTLLWTQDRPVWLSKYTTKGDLCPQVDSLQPNKNNELWKALGRAIDTDEFKNRAILWLGGAVNVPTESYDEMGPVGEDPRWETFGLLHEYLLKAFPLTHSSLELTKINTYALLYTWKGSDSSLKPVLLAAHQDVVPVDPTTVGQWTHPPYSGYFDGERIWGRGSADDKGGLVGILSAVELLLENGFKPTRTILLGFGFDEEASGLQGAARLGEYLLDTYGKDSISMVVDEGGGFIEQYGSVIATPGIAEKGYLDTRVEVNTPGVIPASHRRTHIGILSKLLVAFEESPYEVTLPREDPLYTTLQCFSKHAPSFPSKLGKLIRASANSDKALRALEKIILGDPVYKSLLGTTQAIDLIQGGVKTNALPEQAWAIVNHRISVISSVDKTKEHDAALLKPLALQFNLTYEAFGTSILESGGGRSSGTLKLIDAFQHGLEPAPVTPTGKDAAPYQLLSGTIKATYNAHRSLQGGNTIVVSPGMPSGNTDTRYYWDLSRHIFRYNHGNSGNGTDTLAGFHTVNEFIKADAFLEMIRFSPLSF